MSDELRLGIVLSFSKGGASVKRAEHIEVDVAGDSYVHSNQEFTTSSVALVEPAAIGTPGYVFVKNNHASNYIDVGLDNSFTMRLLAGQFAIFPAAAAIYAKAEGAGSDLEYIIVEL